MSDGFLIYLLAVAENFGGTLDSLSWWMAAVGAFVYVFSVIRYWAVSSEDSYRSAEWNSNEKAREREAYKISEPKVRKFTLVAFALAVVFSVSSALFPTTENVLKAYALIEGSKVINAPNAELAAEAIGKRFDKFLDIVDRGITGRHEQPAPTPVPAPETPQAPAEKTK